MAGYDDLLTLFTDWRKFERPPMLEGAPDYTSATLARKQAELKDYQARLAAIDPGAWPVAQRVDYEIVRAEMNGLDFDLRVLQPWASDPAYYHSLWTEQSDTPAHEGPTQHDIVELWTYTFPLDRAAESKLARELGVHPAPPRAGAAQSHGQRARPVDGRHRDDAAAGRGLRRLDKETSKSGRELKKAIRGAREATAEFVTWLQQQAPSKTGPSGVGKENYTWNLQNVHLVPLTWDEEVTLLERELARAHASLKLEEERNRGLPQLHVTASPRSISSAATTPSRSTSPSCATRPLPDARLHGFGAARAHRRILAGSDAQLLRHGLASRAADALHALLPLVGPGADAREPAPEPHPARAPALTTSGTAAPRAWRPRWRSSCSTRASTTTTRAPARSSGSCSRNAPPAGSLRCARRRTKST
jgi:hypothetical protein